MQWSIIIVLLIFAIISFVISLIIPAKADIDGETKRLNDELLEQSRENYQLKKKIQELEDQLHPRQALSDEQIYQKQEAVNTNAYDTEDVQQNEYFDYDQEESFNLSSDENKFDDYTDYGNDTNETDYQYYPEEDDTPSIETSYDFFNSQYSTKDSIITLYNQGEALEDIANELNVPVSTVQLVIDSYLEEQSLR